MCGRYTQAADLESLMRRFGFEPLEFELKPRYNVAPTQLAPVVVGKEPRSLKLMRWGLVPSWAKDKAIGHKMINARAETLAERPAFKRAFEKRRCLVAADGFYEWRREKDVKFPMRFKLKSGEPFGMAGLWESWIDPATKEPLESFAIVTTQANARLKPIHDRMPVILPRASEEEWLDPGQKDLAKLGRLLAPYPADEIEGYDVSPAVNSPKNDVPELIRKI